MADSSSSTGRVYLVGAGPGDPELATAKALRLIGEADCIVYDRLANPALLEGAKAGAELIDAGKLPDRHKLTQDEINALLAEKALAGKAVVRLKGGDPYIFGRGSEEGMYLHERGVASEEVPGIPAATAAPAYAGIPVTHRQVATTVTFITGHEDPTKGDSQVDYGGLAKIGAAGGTLCFYMGMGRLSVIAEQLQAHGLSGETPAAVVQWGTLPRQRSVRSTLAEVADAVERAGVSSPAIVVVGPVAAVDPDGALRWFERRPLFGQRVVVTRTRHQASALRESLEGLGAEVLEAPTIAIEPPEDWGPVDEAVKGIGGYDWVVLTSANGVTGLAERLEHLGLDARHLGGVKVAAIGDATAAALRAELGIRADLVPTRFVAESLAAELIATEEMGGKRVLLLRADIARPALNEKLKEAGATVEEASIYRTRRADALPEEVLVAMREGNVDWVTFTSSSTVRNFVELLGEEVSLLGGAKAASIGPITSETARELGLTVAVEAARHNISGLVAALRETGGGGEDPG